MSILSNSTMLGHAIPNFALWLNANAPLGFTTPPPSDGTAVSAWANLAPASVWSVAQGTAASQPLFKTGILGNGSAGILFDGVNDALLATTSSGQSSQTLLNPVVNPYTIFMAYQLTDATNKGNLLSTRSGTATSKTTIGRSAAATDMCCTANNGTQFIKSITNSDTTLPHLVRHSWNLSDVTGALDNVTMSGAINISNSNGDPAVVIGSNEASGVFTGVPFKGYIFDVRIFTRVLNASEIAIVQYDMANRSGIILS